MLNVIDREVAFVTWLRYTAWIPLYPTGFVLEGKCVLLKLQTTALQAYLNKNWHRMFLEYYFVVFIRHFIKTIRYMM